MSRVSEDEVLLLWRALRSFRSGRRPVCAPSGRPPTSPCPLFDRCERWEHGQDDYELALIETDEQTERRRANWPCSRLLDLLGPGLAELRNRPLSPSAQLAAEGGR
jgi:hypothetical protein